MNSNISLKDFISYVEDHGRLKVFADFEEMTEEKMFELTSKHGGIEIKINKISDHDDKTVISRVCEIKIDEGNIHFNFFDNTGLYAKTNDCTVAALIAAYCGMVVFNYVDEYKPERSPIEKFVDACKQDIHAVFSDLCEHAQHTETGTAYIINGISCEIQPLRDTDGQNCYIFSVVKTGEQIDVVSDPVFAAMCAIKYGMVEGVTGKIEKQNTPIDVLREISDNADQVIAKCLGISDNEYQAAMRSGYYSKDSSYGDLNIMVSISASGIKKNFRISRDVASPENPEKILGVNLVLTTTDNEVFAHALKRYGIYDLACGYTKEKDNVEDLPMSQINPWSYKFKAANNADNNHGKCESKKPIKHQTLKEKIDAHNDELANQIILQYHEGLINSMQMAEQFQALRNNMLDTFASYSLT